MKDISQIKNTPLQIDSKFSLLELLISQIVTAQTTTHWCIWRTKTGFPTSYLQQVYGGYYINIFVFKGTCLFLQDVKILLNCGSEISFISVVETY